MSVTYMEILYRPLVSKRHLPKRFDSRQIWRNFTPNIHSVSVNRNTIKSSLEIAECKHVRKTGLDVKLMGGGGGGGDHSAIYPNAHRIFPEIYLPLKIYK
ncbi:hypothetical protein GDO81_007009 [Engystomops pustulosus]|uniref:Uncharacterized protein n=1 Tax=Engystomops pustulosus TaxID=76066 RepID=A0AAV7D2D8_ENGPU|nr:hypothetical protein GDO81_007009 [Engystomops pustulosus]